MRVRLLNLVIVLSLGMMVSVVSTATGAGKVWVTSEGAKLQADKSASSSTVAKLPVGAELILTSSDGSWYQVSTGSGKKGWIYRGKVSTTPPRATSQGGGTLFAALPGSSIQANAADTSRSIRRLDSQDGSSAQRRDPAACHQALNDVLNLRVTEAEVERFLKEGRIGEYAR